MTAVVFDLDGTLVDSAPDLHAAAAEMTEALGLPTPSRDEIVSYIGNGIPTLVARCLDRAGLAPTDARREEALRRFIASYQKAPAKHTRPYPGVRQTLSKLRADGIALGVCTNKTAGLSWRVLEETGLAPLIAELVGGDTLPVRKPHPEPLRTVVGRLGATHEDAFFVGDSEVDSETAAAANMPFALFTRGYRKSRVSAIAHAFAFDDFAALHIPSRQVIV